MDVSRYEVNRQVRMVLNKYGIDLTRIDYSCIGSTVYLSGELLKACEGDIVPTVIEGLFREIARLSGVRNVQSDLQNWNISADGNSWQITKSKKKSRDIVVPVGTTEAAEDVHIETSEEIADVLKDIKRKSEQEDR